MKTAADILKEHWENYLATEPDRLVLKWDTIKNDKVTLLQIEAMREYASQAIDSHIKRLEEILANPQYSESPRLKEGIGMAIVNANEIKKELQ